MKENDWQIMRYFILWLVLLFMIALTFYGIFRIWKKICKITCYNFFGHYFVCIATVKSLQFSRILLRLLCQTPVIEMPLLNRNEKVTWENCCTQTTKLNLARHKKRFSVGTLHRTQCPNFSTKSQKDMNYHFAEKHSAPKPDVTFKCKLCYQEFPGFYPLRQHRNTQHGMQIGSGTKDVNVEQIGWDIEDRNLREELRSCQHFLAVSELERARQKVFSYAVETGNETIVNEKLDHFFNNMKCAAIFNLAVGFILADIEVGEFRYFYAHEKITLLDRSKVVCASEDLAELNDFLNKTDVIESCCQEKMNTNWTFYKLSHLTVFAALPKDVAVGCKNAVLPEPPLRNGTITVSRLKKIQDNHITTTSAFFVLLLSACKKINDWKKKLQNFSDYV